MPKYTIYGVQRDWETDNWFFLVFKDEAATKVAFESKPLYPEEDDARAAAEAWIANKAKAGTRRK